MAKILIVVDDFVAGGAFRVGERLTQGLLGKSNITYACDISQVNEAARHSLSGAGANIVRLFAHAGQTRRATYDFDSANALIRKSDPNKILFVDSSPRSNVALKEVAHANGIPFVSIVNFVDRATPNALRVFDIDVMRAANAAHANVFVSLAARIDFEANYPGVAAPRFVVTNGVPDVFFEPVASQKREALRRQLGILDDEVMLLLPGRLEPRKGQDVALSALSAVASRGGGPSMLLVLAGHGDDEEKLKLAEQIRALGLGGRVQYLGPRDDLPLLLDACDIVLMPSHQEADGLVGKEAMAKGRPVVASDLRAIREQGHTDALLIPAPEDAPERSVAALADILDDLRRDKSKRAEIGRSLREIAQKRFTMTQMVDAYLQIIKSMPIRNDPVPVKKAPVVFGRWIHVAESRHASGVFKDGWTDIENDGIWSVGICSRIFIALDEPQNELSFTIDCHPLTRGEVFLWVNGRNLGKWTFSSRKRVRRTFRLRLPCHHRHVLIRLRNANPASPFTLGLGADRRPLGLFVHALRIDVGTEPQGGLAGARRRIAKIWDQRRTRG